METPLNILGVTLVTNFFLSSMSLSATWDMGQFWEPLGTIMEGQRVALEAQIIAELSLSLN